MTIIVIVILVLVILTLVIYNIHIQRKIEAFNNMNDRINNLSVLQDFMKIAGEEDSVENKLKRINEIIIDKYNIKYSTIVVFDGAEYVIKASNVDPKHYSTLTNLHNEEIFQDSVNTATPKYITVEDDNEKLPYQRTEMGRAKSAMFFPLFIDNIYIGYWIMESSQMHAFDNVDTTIIEVVKDNIISVLQTVAYQDTIENIDRTDEFTKLHSAEYLYGKAKKVIDEYATSAVTMFKVMNIKEINEEFGRQMGNEIITQVANIVKSKIPQEYIFVRYMGPKFVIVFSGVEEVSVEQFLKDLKYEIESLALIEEDDDDKSDSENEKNSKENDDKTEGEEEIEEDIPAASPVLDFVVSTYYKGTGLEKLTKKLEEYMDTVPENESRINFI